MNIISYEVYIETKHRREVINITGIIEDYLNKTNINNGLAIIFLPHSTAGLFANEDENNLKIDYINFFEKLVPENGEYNHNKIDNNGDSHLLSSIFKQFYIFPIKDRKLIKGTWQELFLAEFDGPRKRKIIIMFLGE